MTKVTDINEFKAKTLVKNATTVDKFGKPVVTEKIIKKAEGEVEITIKLKTPPEPPKAA